MEGHGSKFGRKKEEAIAALLTQRNVEEAARVAGIGTQTLIRWLKIPEFQAAYREARRAAVSQSNARLQQASSRLVLVPVDRTEGPLDVSQGPREDLQRALLTFATIVETEYNMGNREHGERTLAEGAVPRHSRNLISRRRPGAGRP